MTPDQWLNECAAHAYAADQDKGGAPLAWLARAATKRAEAIEEFGQAAFDAAYARQEQPKP